LDIITKWFFHDDGELVVFGDEKQNIYERTMDDSGEPIIKMVPGRWNKSLDQIFRCSESIANLLMDFQIEFLKDKYELDEMRITTTMPYLPLGKEYIEYYLLNDYSPDNLHKLIRKIVRKHEIHPSDVSILDSRVEMLRNLDFLVRTKSHEKTKTTFETKEVFDYLYEKIRKKVYATQATDLEPEQELILGDQVDVSLKDKIDTIRRHKKNHFWMKTGTMKLSTIHSFKGWEIPSLILLLDEEKEDSDFTTDEIIYTGLSRARYYLFIINASKNRYDTFFRQKVEQVFDV